MDCHRYGMKTQYPGLNLYNILLDQFRQPWCREVQSSPKESNYRIYRGKSLDFEKIFIDFANKTM